MVQILLDWFSYVDNYKSVLLRLFFLYLERSEATTFKSADSGKKIVNHLHP
jgi:hypothetical protein